MNITKNGKTLYHIQNMNVYSDGTCFDTFVYCDHYPTDTDLLLVYGIEFPDDKNNNELIEEFLNSSEVYRVYAEEL